MATTLGRLMSPLTGVVLNSVTTDQRHNLGTVVFDNVGRKLQYVKANGTLTADAPVTITEAFLTTVSGNGGRVDGVTPIAAVANDYLWVVVEGQVTADVETGLAAGEYFVWTANASGQLDEVALATDAKRGVLVGTAASNKATVRLF